jgi:hypothetical protein
MTQADQPKLPTASCPRSATVALRASVILHSLEGFGTQQPIYNLEVVGSTTPITEQDKKDMKAQSLVAMIMPAHQ